MNNKIILGLLIVCTLTALLLHLFRMNSVPSGFNADEAAYGYNAYSILKTGRDEYGNLLPLRLVSFGDYKLPGYSYVLIPFVALFGLLPWVVRLPALIASLGLVWITFLLAKDLFKNKYVGVIAAGIVAISPGIHILARHAHETVPATALVMLGIWSIVKLFSRPKHQLLYALLGTGALVASMYFYHSARLYALGLFPILLLSLYQSRSRISSWFITIGLFLIAFIPSLIADLYMPPARIASLFIGNSEGITLLQQQLVIEFARSPFSTREFVLLWEILRRYVSYFSPDFLIFSGDISPRFGISSMSIVSIVEYVLFLSGFYYLIKTFKRNPTQGILLYALALAPLSAAFAWQERAFNRSYLMIPLLLIIAAYGAVMLYESTKKWRIAPLVWGIVLIAGLLLNIRTWEFYFYHYPLRPTVIRAWESGFRELIQSIDKTRYKKIIVGAKDGQPYIHFLFWSKSPPQEIQGKALREKADEYGYTQVRQMGNIFFSSDIPQDIEKNTRILLVLSDDQAKTFTTPERICANEKSKVSHGTETLFVTYELTGKQNGNCSPNEKKLKP